MDSAEHVVCDRQSRRVGTGHSTLKEWACVCRFGGVGDNLIASSVLPLLATDYNVEVITQTPQSDVFVNNPYISKLTVLEPGSLPSDNMAWQQWFVSRSKEYKKLVNLSHSCETLLVFVPAQSQFYWPAEWRRRQCNVSYLEAVHDIVGVPHVFAPQFFPNDEEYERAERTKQEVGGRYIAWILSGTRADKILPTSPQAIARLIRETGLPVIMLGAPGLNAEMAKTIQERVKKQNGTDNGLYSAVSADATQTDPDLRDRLGLKDGVEAWPIRRVLTQAMAADLVVTVDTGVGWAVAMSDMPKIMLLSHASPTNITQHWNNTVTLHADPKRVPCWPCHQLHQTIETCVPNADNTGAACISDISVETIVRTASKLLTGE